MFKLTDLELSAARMLVDSCLDGMCGSCIEDLWDDLYTWCESKDLEDCGMESRQARGVYGSLMKKGVVLDGMGDGDSVSEAFLKYAQTEFGW